MTLDGLSANAYLLCMLAAEYDSRGLIPMDPGRLSRLRALARKIIGNTSKGDQARSERVREVLPAEACSSATARGPDGAAAAVTLPRFSP